MTAPVHRWVLSGGIGSGKSSVRDLLGEHGFESIDADGIGHQVLEPDGAAFDEVTSRWPDTVVDGQIDRKALGRVVFNDSSQLHALESITHPYIFGTIRGLVNQNDGPVVVEIPLLQHGLGDEWRRVIVDCDEEVRLRRLLDRGMSEDDARSRMAAQPSRSQWLAIADLVIPNIGSLEELSSTVTRALPAM